MTIRQYLMGWHRWIGVVVFAPLVVIALTGVVLVVADSLERQMVPERYRVTAGLQKPYNDHILSAQSALGAGHLLTTIRPPKATGSPLIIDASGPAGELMRVWLDPASANVLGISDLRQSPLRIIHGIHASLLIPAVGSKIVGVFGMCLFVLAASGVVIWTLRKSLLTGFAWRRSSRLIPQLHHWVGIVAAVPVAIIAVTGIYLTSYDIAAALYRRFFQSAQVELAPAQGLALDADAAVAVAQVLSPAGQILRISVPRGNSPWLLTMQAPNSRATETIAVRSADLPAQVVERINPIYTLSGWMVDIHAGYIGGPLWTAVIVFSGLALVALGGTGLMMWSGRRAARINTDR